MLVDVLSIAALYWPRRAARLPCVSACAFTSSFQRGSKSAGAVACEGPMRDHWSLNRLSSPSASKLRRPRRANRDGHASNKVESFGKQGRHSDLRASGGWALSHSRLPCFLDVAFFFQPLSGLGSIRVLTLLGIIILSFLSLSLFAAADYQVRRDVRGRNKQFQCAPGGGGLAIG